MLYEVITVELNFNLLISHVVLLRKRTITHPLAVFWYKKSRLTKTAKEEGLRQTLQNRPLRHQALSPDNLQSHKTGAAGSAKVRRACCPILSTNPQRFDNDPVALDIFLLQIIEQPPALTDDFQQSATGMMILFVGAKMFGEVSNPFRK